MPRALVSVTLPIFLAYWPSVVSGLRISTISGLSTSTTTSATAATSSLEVRGGPTSRDSVKRYLGVAVLILTVTGGYIGNGAPGDIFFRLLLSESVFILELLDFSIESLLFPL